MRPAVFVGIVLLVAGCAGSTSGPTTQTTEPTSNPAAAAPEPLTPTPRSTHSTAPPRASEPPPSTVEIAINSSADRDFAAPVLAAIDYWDEPRIDRHGAYPAVLEYSPDARDPDVEIRFVEDIPNCGSTVATDARLRGCADVSEEPPNGTVVEVHSGQTDNGIRFTVMHELGHVLGLEHGEEPTRVMTADTGSALDATDREWPWIHDGDVRIAVASDSGDRATVREAIRAVISRFDAAPARLPQGVELTFVRNWYEADILVDYRPDADGCDRGSKAVKYGLDYDGDDALEEYKGARVQLCGLEADELDDHVSRWIDRLVGSDRNQPPDPYGG